MPKGGARVNPGPAPDPNAIRRGRQSDQETWTDLPAAGYTGPIPAWPLADGDEIELTIWAELWRTPQAVVWARQRWTRDVAQYARHKMLAESGSTKDASEARQWSDRLGLNPAALLRNRWRVVDVDAAGAVPAQALRRPSARSRLTVVSDGDGD